MKSQITVNPNELPLISILAKSYYYYCPSEYKNVDKLLFIYFIYIQSLY